MKIILFLFALCMNFGLFGIQGKELQQVFSSPSPFKYPINIKVLPSKQENASVTLCCHGFGGDSRIGVVIRKNPAVKDHIITFNFPDANIPPDDYDPHTTTFGSIQELLPPLYILKQCVVDGGVDKVNLYGFSAGGASVVNIIALLNRFGNEKDLQSIGITPDVKQKILQALQKGYVILDCPMKSVEEIISVKGPDPRFKVLAERYQQNHFRPMDSVQDFQGLSLNILVHFQFPDEVVPNRDDVPFVQNLQKANAKGRTWTVMGSDGGHNAHHASLWSAFQEFQHPEAPRQVLMGNRQNVRHFPIYQSLRQSLGGDASGQIFTETEEDLPYLATENLDLLFITSVDNPSYKTLKSDPRAIFKAKKVSMQGKAYEQQGKLGTQGWQLLEKRKIASACELYRDPSYRLFKLCPDRIQFTEGETTLVIKEVRKKPKA
jgi:pimeloyl-ACP methyl ester carboxylesterase